MWLTSAMEFESFILSAPASEDLKVSITFPQLVATPTKGLSGCFNVARIRGNSVDSMATGLSVYSAHPGCNRLKSCKGMCVWTP